MILPIILHHNTRNSLPKKINTPLSSWIEKNPSVYMGFSERLISMKPFTKEALLYGLVNDLIFFDDNGEVNTDFKLGLTDKFLRKLEGESRECVLKSRLLGRWFGSSGSAQKIMFLWGIRP
jgi:hypothetical protein